MKHKIAFLALLLIYSLYFLLGDMFLARFGFSIGTSKINGVWSIFTGNFLFDGYANVLYFVCVMAVVALLGFSIGATFSSKVYLSLAVLPFVLSSVGTGIAYKIGASVSGQSGVISVFGGMVITLVAFEYTKWLHTLTSRDLVLKLFSVLITLFIILTVMSLFSLNLVVLIDHGVSFILGIVSAVFVYKSNFHFSRLARNDWLLVKLQEVS